MDAASARCGTASVDQALDLGGLRQPGQVIEPAAPDRLDLAAHAERLFQPVGELALDHPSRGALIAGFNHDGHGLAPAFGAFQHADVFAVGARVLADDGADGFGEYVDPAQLHHVVAAAENFGNPAMDAAAGAFAAGD